MTVKQYLIPAANVAMRGASLVGRFALAIYMARYLDLRAVGLFGLITGVVGIGPSVIGFGLNYFLNREIVGASPFVAGRRLRDRLTFTISSIAVWGAVLALVLGRQLSPYLQVSVLIPFILVLEFVAFDIHLGIISMKRPVLANFLLFLRNASWIFPLIALGVLVPAFRRADYIYVAWLTGLVVNFAILIFFMRSMPLREIGAAPIDLSWFRKNLRRSGLIYINDFGIAGQIYADRFVIDHFLGLSSTGLYTLYWSLANAIHVLITTAVIQVSLPTLVELHRKGDYRLFRAGLAGEVRKIVVLAGVLAAGAIFAALVALPMVGVTRFAGMPALFILMCVGIIIRLTSDAVSYGLYASGRDNVFALINILALVISLVSTSVCVKVFGLLGVGMSMVIVPSTLLILRVRFLRPSAGDIASDTHEVAAS